MRIDALKYSASWLILFFVVLILPGCMLSEFYSADSEVSVLFSLPMRGTNHIGQNVVNGAILAAEELAYSAGGYEVKYIVKDNGDINGEWSGDFEKSIAHDAAEDSSIVAYVGPYGSGASKVSLPVTNRSSLLQISPGSNWPGLTKAGYQPGEPSIYYPTGKRNFFRLSPDDYQMGVASAVWAKKLGFSRVYLLEGKHKFDSAISEIFEQKSADLDLEILAHDMVDVEKLDIMKERIKIENARPDLLFVSGIDAASMASLFEEIKKIKNRPAVMIGGYMNPYASSSLSPDMGGAYVVLPGQPFEIIEDKAREFTESYRKRFNAEPDTNSAYGYDIARIIFGAIDSTGNDRKRIIDYVRSIDLKDGIFGPVKFAEDGNPANSVISGYAVIGGKLEFREILNDL